MSLYKVRSSGLSRPAHGLFSGLAAEFSLFRQPKVFLAALALIFVPSLYVLIYVSSVWDPYGNLTQLPAAIVNQDAPVMRLGREVNLGKQIVDTLDQQRPFSFVHYATPEAAKTAVQSGKAFFALLIPANFSQRAMATNQPAQLGLYVSEGGNYTASLVSKRFGTELAHTLNEKLNRERWAALVGPDGGSAAEPTLGQGLAALQAGGRRILAASTKIRAGSAELKEGLVRAADGAGKLAEGATQMADGSARLTHGVKQLGEVVADIRGKLPDDGKLKELANGSEALTRGALALKEGMDQLQQGAVRLDAGTGEFQAGAAKVPFFGGRLSAGSAQLHTGVSALGEGIKRTAAGSGQLNDGIKQLDFHVQPLATGLIELNAGLHTMSEKLPTSDQLDLLDRSMGRLREGNLALTGGLGELNQGAGQLQDGAGELEKGAGKLAAGLDEAASRFEAGFGGARASHLAASVETVTEVIAPVPQNGPAFSPYFAALSLWIGAVMMSFVFHLRRLPSSMRRASRPVRWLVKAIPLLCLGLLQATVVVAVLKVGLGIHLANPYLVWAMAGLGSVTFVSLIVLFITLLGDAGRLGAVVFLILQLSASGGIYPIELSPLFYQRIHDYLPFTFLVRSFRTTMFSAFGGRWEPDALLLAYIAVGAMLAGLLLARWKYVPHENYGPAVEF